MARPVIRRLDESTVAKIAAGEVVERPASVVKELYENALDAGAAEIQIRWTEGGLGHIEVADDGEGIAPEELGLAVERHATSKLGGVEDLRAITSLGFRGEALAAIASVARFRLLSRPASETVAHGLSVVGGSAAGRFVAGRSVGTTVEVEELFFNVPARRKFLHAAAVEQLEIISTIDRLYLARPDVAVVAAAEGREVVRYPPSDSLRDAAGRVFGPEFLRQSFVALGGEAGIRVEAVLSRPSLSRSTASSLALAVNDRVIQSRQLAQSVRQAFQGYLPAGRFPLGALHLAVPPDRLDVNVHPTKREVRLSREREISDLVRRTVREAIQRSPHVSEPGRLAASTSTTAPPAASVAAAAGAVIDGGSRSGIHAPQRTLTPESAPASAHVVGSPRHPSLRLLGSIFQLYWVAESEEGLVLVDQHAASERVLFDVLKKSGRLARQELLSPVRVTLTPAQAAAWKAHADALGDAGYVLEEFGGEVYRLSAVPSYRGRRASVDGLAPLLDELAAEPAGSPSREWTDRRAASVACHAAVRAGDALSAEEMGRILDALYRGTEDAYACPHGRPILVSFSRVRLDRIFLRSGP